VTAFVPFFLRGMANTLRCCPFLGPGMQGIATKEEIHLHGAFPIEAITHSASSLTYLSHGVLLYCCGKGTHLNMDSRCDYVIIVNEGEEVISSKLFRQEFV